MSFTILILRGQSSFLAPMYEQLENWQNAAWIQYIINSFFLTFKSRRLLLLWTHCLTIQAEESWVEGMEVGGAEMGTKM